MIVKSQQNRIELVTRPDEAALEPSMDAASRWLECKADEEDTEDEVGADDEAVDEAGGVEVVALADDDVEADADEV